MNIQQLEYIVALDKYKSFSRAAEACFITQATLSTMVKRLEIELELTIFDRKGNPLITTDCGREIINEAQIVLRHSNRIKQLADEQKLNIVGNLKIGIIPTVAGNLLHRILPGILAKYPQYAHLFNDKNSEFNVSANVYLDTWTPIYPKELQEFADFGNTLNSPLFDQFTITGNTAYNPINFKIHDNKNRNSFALSFAFSQVINKKLQVSFFMDVLHQQGLLSTPYQRVYFADKNDAFINEFHLADDIERLPDTRFKIPMGVRLNYYLNEKFVLRSYYRFYSDDWNIQSHTFNVEIPYKLTDRFTVFPMYRYYTQTATNYFAPYNQHLSTETYYTSDYDLSTFVAHQYGFGVNYTDIFMGSRIWRFGIKNIDFRYNHYTRNDGLSANIVSFGIKFVLE